MAKQPTTTDITNIETAAGTINNNFDAVKEAFDNTLSLDGSTPNQMEADIDLNGNDLLNVGVVEAQDITVGGESVSSAAERAEAAAEAAEESASRVDLGALDTAVSEAEAAQAAAETAQAEAEATAASMTDALDSAVEDATSYAEAAQVAAEAAATEAEGYASDANISQVAAAASVTSAQAIQDATALIAQTQGAYTDTTIAAAIAAGVAALTVGDTFTATGGDVDYIGLYVIETGPVATEIAKLPKSEVLDSLLATIADEKTLSQNEYVFVVRSPDTLKSPFAIRDDELGTIDSPHVNQIEGDVATALRSWNEVQPSSSGLAWAVTQDTTSAGNKAVILGVRGTDGRIINPSFDTLWDAVFGSGGTGDGDLAEEDSIIMHGPHIYAVEGRSIELYASSLLPNRNRSATAREFSLQSVTDDGRPLGAVFNNYYRVSAEDLGSTARIKLKNEAMTGVQPIEFSKDITVIHSPASKTGSPKVQMIGDSITSQVSDFVVSNLAGTNLTPDYIGSILSDGGIRHEGRSGWRFSDYIYSYVRSAPENVITILPEGDEASYLALSRGQAGLLNPFVRPSESGDDPSVVFNGYVFDYRYYLDRFSLSDPDIITINLGTNDINYFDSTVGLADSKLASEIMIDSIRAACPNVKIGLALPMNGNNSYANPRWYNGYAQLFLYYHEIYGNSSGDGIYLISTHAQSEDRFTQKFSVLETNSQTGQEKTEMSDLTHPDYYLGIQQLAEGLSAFIHAIA